MLKRLSIRLTINLECLSMFLGSAIILPAYHSNQLIISMQFYKISATCQRKHPQQAS